MPARTSAARIVLLALLCQWAHPNTSLALLRGSAAPQAASKPAESKWTVVLIEAEYKTVKHPEKDYFAVALPDGLRMSFMTPAGHFGRYAFPTEQFPLNESVYLLSKGSPDLLPVKVTRINATDYRLEWLPASPSQAGAVKVVGSR
jgi:hypothetical protein